MSDSLYQLGWWPDGEAAALKGVPDIEHRYAKCYERQQTTGPQRLCIGIDNNPIPLILALAECLTTPLAVLYILTGNFGQQNEARYQSPSLDREGLSDFLWTYSE